MLVYTAEPATPTADALNLLASWAATQDHADHTRAGNRRGLTPRHATRR